MATNVATLTATLEADIRKFDRDLRKAEKRLDDLDGETKRADRSQRKLTDRFKNVGFMAGIAATAVAGMAVKLGVDSVRAASDLQESLNALEVTYGEHATGLREIGENAADSFGMSQRAFNEFAVRFSAFADNIANQSGRQVVDVVDEMTTRVADFASVHNLSLEEAARVAQSTLAGETEVFRRFGGDVSAAAVNAKALELGLAGVGNELTEQEKQLVRYQLFMEQTADTAGDFANTSNNLANLQRRLNASWEDAQAELGKAFIPALEDALPVLIDVVKQIGEMATDLAVLTGALSKAEGFLIKWGIRTGQSADTTTALANAAAFLSEEIREQTGNFRRAGQSQQALREELLSLFDAFEGGTDELIDLRNNFDLWVETLELGEEEAKILAEVLGVALTDSFDEARGAAHSFDRSARGAAERAADVVDAASADRKLFAYAEGLEEMGDEASNTAPSLQDVAEAAAAINNAAREAASPVFAAVSAIQRLEEAAEDGNADFFEMSELTLDAQSALADLGAGNVVAGITAIADAMEVPRSHVAQMLEDLGILDSTDWSTNLLFDISVDPADRKFLDQALRLGTGGAVDIDTSRLSPNVVRQHGGPFTANTPMVVGERGPEVVEFDRSGQVQPDTRGLGNMGGPVVVQLVLDGRVLAEEVVRADEVNRRRGL